MTLMTKIEAPEESRDYRRIARAIRYLAEHYAEQPSLEEAAGVSGLSAFHFQRTFSRYVGISPKSFVGHLTLEHASAELKRGASVLDAALEAGLSGSSRLHDLSVKIQAMTPGEYSKGGAGLAIAYGFHDSLFGSALIMTTDKGVCGIAFSEEGDEDAAFDDMRARWPDAAYRRDDAATAPIARRLFGVENGKSLAVHLMGTKWQIQIWRALLAIPLGSVASYRTIAGQIGAPNAGRAVGAAVGRNPVAWLIPCHRVLGHDGKLTGYHWGIARKRAMLAVEAARVDQSPRTSAIA
jgi:AraC family transcriptional regulator of adaptative response/methylated-DNA-[protein]-cysteine methyltransferase